MNHTLAQAFAQCAHQSASADNSQPWHFTWDECDFIIYYDQQRAEGKTFPPLNPATLLAIGSCIDNILHYAHKHHLLVQYKYVLSDVNKRFEFVRITAQNQPEISKNLPLPEFIRETNRLEFQSTSLPQDTILDTGASTVGQSRTVFLTQKPIIKAISQQVYAASEIRFQTQEVHEWLGKSLRFDKDQGALDGLDVKTLDLPPGGVLFLKLISDWRRMAILNKVGTYKLLSLIDTAPVKKAPGLIGIIGTNSSHGALDSGQLLNNVWTQLNKRGLAVHPYYVIPDLLYRLQEGLVPSPLENQARSVYSACKDHFSLSDAETLYMLLRVGHPKKKPHPSRRLPIDVVFTDPTNSSRKT